MTKGTRHDAEKGYPADQPPISRPGNASSRSKKKRKTGILQQIKSDFHRDVIVPTKADFRSIVANLPRARDFALGLVFIGLIVLFFWQVFATESTLPADIATRQDRSQPLTIKHPDHIGCRIQDTKNKLTDLVLSRDKKAFYTLFLEQIEAGHCRVFKVGEKVRLEGSTWMGMACLRVAGGVNCFWTEIDSVK